MAEGSENKQLTENIKIQDVQSDLNNGSASRVVMLDITGKSSAIPDLNLSSDGNSQGSCLPSGSGENMESSNQERYGESSWTETKKNSLVKNRNSIPHDVRNSSYSHETCFNASSFVNIDITDDSTSNRQEKGPSASEVKHHIEIYDDIDLHQISEDIQGNIRHGENKHSYSDPATLASQQSKPLPVFDKRSSRKDRLDNGHNLHIDPVCWECEGHFRSNSILSYSSDEDFEDAELPYQLVFPEDFSGLDNDWDSGLSSNSNNSHDDLDDDDEWEDAFSMLENLGREISLEDMVRGRRGQETAPLYPHRPLMFHECQVCLVSSHLRRRVCCDFKICHHCITTYVTMKVNEAKVQIECPNDRCHVLVHRDEINERLPKEMKNKFAKFLVDANADPHRKTCPACSEIQEIDPKLLANKKKLKYGFRVVCPQCSLQWCFPCQAPFHSNITCKQFLKGDEMVRRWAKERSYGQSNAQRCPKCKIFIQKVHGCDHMKCTRCNTDFCYRCGDRYISIKLLGNHWSRFSLFGCKYRLMPEKPALRRLLRGANFAARLVAGVILAGLGLAAGAVLVGASVVIVPGYGIVRLKRHLVRRKERSKRQKIFSAQYANDDQRSREYRGSVSQGQTSRSNEELETVSSDTQQLQILVHRSVSFSQEDAADPPTVPSKEGCDFYINRYTADGTDIIVNPDKSGEDSSDDVVVVADIKEIPNTGGGYPTLVANIVSKVVAADSKDAQSKDKTLKKERKISNPDAPTSKIDLDEPKLQEEEEECGVCSKDHKTFPTIRVPPDQPSCSWENLSSCGRKDLADDCTENSTCQNKLSTPVSNTGTEAKIGEVNPEQEDCSTCIDTQLGTVTLGDDGDSTKGGNNGCFGNIFSKCSQIPGLGLEDLNSKCQMSNFPKKLLNCKAATWEKCRRDSFDPKVDLSVIMCGESKSGVRSLNRDLEPDTKLSKLAPQNSALSEDIQSDEECDKAVRANADNKMNERDTGKGLQGCISTEDEVGTIADGVGRLDASLHLKKRHGSLTEGCYISEYSAVTYL